MSGRVELTDPQRTALLTVAAQAIGEALASGQIENLDERRVSDDDLLRRGAAFVTLLRDDELLGCVGSLHPVEALALAVHRAALQAAFADARLPSVTVDDYEQMTIKVSVLSELEPVEAESFAELVSLIRPKVDGIVIEAPRHRATLLPSVWEQCAGVEAFLTALWAKAGLAPGVWVRGLRVERYTTDEFESHGPRRMVQRT